MLLTLIGDFHDQYGLCVRVELIGSLKLKLQSCSLAASWSLRFGNIEISLISLPDGHVNEVILCSVIEVSLCVVLWFMQFCFEVRLEGAVSQKRRW